uniref:Putative secreted protein n=1 Tax=Anopheles darlingi TaxID=43151 RepID=A0A2M4DR93_ANODA
MFFLWFAVCEFVTSACYCRRLRFVECTQDDGDDARKDGYSQAGDKERSSQSLPITCVEVIEMRVFG